MATNVIPNTYRTHIGSELISEISTSPENTYYMFLGAHMPQGGVIPDLSDDTHTMIEAYRDMICAKAITPSDASLMIRNIQWTANTVYDMYDDADTTSATDQFYAIVNAGAFSHVWKCLDNNMAGPSTVPPDISQIDPSDTSYRTSDGYLWKYMASSTSATITKFGTDTYFPLTANAQVTAAAVPGAIDVFAISNTGSGYRNWLLGTFSASDLRVNGNTITYAVTGNSQSSAVNGFYTGCSIYISGGSGIGQYKTITDYYSNANGNFIVIDTPFLTNPQNGDTYQIYPSVSIKGDGAQTIQAAARALVNAVGNTIYRIDMLSRGAGYSFISGNVVANSVAAPTYPAIIRGIYAPFGGHGYSAAEELGATRVSFSVSFANTEANTIPATNQFQQLGILKNPQFQNVVVNFTTMYGTFIGNETVVTYTTRFVSNTVSTTAGSPNVSVSNAQLTLQLSAGDPVIISAADNTAYWYSTVNNIANDTFLTLTSSPTWGSTTATLSLATLQSGTGKVTSLPGGNTVGLSNVSGSFDTGTLVIGQTTGARGVTNNVTRNAVVKGFSTFVPMFKFVATATSGTFQPNEYVYMGDNVASATSIGALHSVVANSGTLTMYLSNTVGTFSEDLTGSIRGSNSGAVAVLTTKYSPEISFGSSKVLYLENISPVTRSNNTTDTINVILEF